MSFLEDFDAGGFIDCRFRGDWLSGPLLVSGWVYDLFGRSFPYGTFAVNILGAFVIGLVMEFGMRSTLLPVSLRIGLTIGFLGGLNHVFHLQL